MAARDLETYMDAAAVLIDLPIPPECRPGVLENLARMQQLAGAFLEFALPPDIEPANTFEP